MARRGFVPEAGDIVWLESIPKPATSRRAIGQPW